jgi:hypothetical protein
MSVRCPICGKIEDSFCAELTINPKAPQPRDSAGERLGRETMRLAAMDAAAGAQIERQVEHNKAVCAIADEIEKYTDKRLEIYREMALKEMGDSTPRSPAQSGLPQKVENE